MIYERGIMEYKKVVLRAFQYSIMSFSIVLLVSCGNDTSKSPSEVLSNEPTHVDDKETDKETAPVDDKETDKEPIKKDSSLPWEKGVLKVSADKHNIEHTDGSDFFWMADTAWDIFIRLSDEKIDTYLKNRKALGFNVILMRPVEDQKWQVHNIGESAFDIDPSTGNKSFKFPNEKCWKHVDAVIKKAEKLGMYIGLLPSWNMTFTRKTKNGNAPQGIVNVEDAKWYGKWIANRYKDNKNIIWVMGGDSGPGNPAGDDRTLIDNDENQRSIIWKKKEKIWNALATEIHKVVKEKQLITFHTAGGDTALSLFKDQKWLDFSMGQTGHCVEGDIDFAQTLVTSEYKKSNPLPMIDGEPKYEGIEKCFYMSERVPKEPKYDGSRFTGEELIETAYRQVFSGAFGYTYGNHAIWLFWEKPGDFNSSSVPAKSWTEALDDPGAKYMNHLVNLIKSRPGSRKPDQKVVGEEPGKEGVYDNPLATKGDGYVFIYQPKYTEAKVNLEKISFSVANLTMWSYDPLTGNAKNIPTDKSTNTIELPVSEIKDMVYVLDDKGKNYGKPGVLK